MEQNCLSPVSITASEHYWLDEPWFLFLCWILLQSFIIRSSNIDASNHCVCFQIWSILICQRSLITVGSVPAMVQLQMEIMPTHLFTQLLLRLFPQNIQTIQMNRSLRNHLNHILPIFNGDILYHFLILKILFPTHFFSNILNIYSVVHFEMHQKESKESFLHNDKTYQRFFVPLQRNSISNTTHHLQKIHNFSEIFSLFKIFHITFVLVC